MVAGCVRFGGVRSIMVDAGGVCACVMSHVIYVAWRLRRRPWFCPRRFCWRFLPFPGPPLLSTVRLRGPSGGPLGAGSPERTRRTTSRCRGPRGGPLGARSPARTGSSTGRLRGPSGGPLGARSPGRRRKMMLRCRGPRVGPLGAQSPARPDSTTGRLRGLRSPGRWRPPCRVSLGNVSVSCCVQWQCSPPPPPPPPCAKPPR